MEEQSRERRKCVRFDTSLDCTIKQSSSVYQGVIKNFSRQGLKLYLSQLDALSQDLLEMTIKDPRNNTNIAASGEVLWKRIIGSDCELGIRLKHISPEQKAALLDYSYRDWVKRKKETMS